MEKSRPLERVQLANQIIGPLGCWRKKVKYLLPVCQILWYFTEATAKKVTFRFFAFFVHIDVRKYRNMKPKVRWAFLSMCRLLNKLASSAHMQLLNFREPPWTILTNKRIIVVLTMERCRLWSVDQYFNGEGHLKKPTRFATSPIASKYSAVPLTDVSASKVSAIKRKFYKEATWRLSH